MRTTSSMPTRVERGATELAQRQTKTGDFRPRYILKIGDELINTKLYDCTVTYSADGTSDLSISADTDLEAFAGRPVELQIGYGDFLWDYFGGWLEEPENDNWGAPSTADAYGPFKELGELSLQTDISYEAQLLGAAITDLHAKARLRGSTFEVAGNPNYPLEGETAKLALGTSFSDALNTLLEMAGWVSQDRPGFRRRYRPAPRPRPSGAYVAAYSEAHFAPGAFRATLGKPYGSVGAFARDDDGRFKWAPVIVEVDPSVSPLKTFWLEDFAGTEDDAWEEVGRMASTLSAGIYTWTLEGISANPELELHDVIRVHTTELRDEGGRFKERYDVEYACAIDSEVSVDVSRDGHPMNLSGNTAIKVKEKRVKRYQPVAARLQSPVARILTSSSDTTFDDVSGDTFNTYSTTTFENI